MRHPTLTNTKKEQTEANYVLVNTGRQIDLEEDVQLDQAGHGQERDVHGGTGQPNLPVQFEAVQPERKIQTAERR